MRDLAYYGCEDVIIDRKDIREVSCLSIDLRAETGAGLVTDETRIVPPGTFTLSVCGSPEGEPPIGEIRIWFEGGELSIVGHLTERLGIRELTPDHLRSMLDRTYQAQILRWLRGEKKLC